VGLDFDWGVDVCARCVNELLVEVVDQHAHHACEFVNILLERSYQAYVRGLDPLPSGHVVRLERAGPRLLECDSGPGAIGDFEAVECHGCILFQPSARTVECDAHGEVFEQPFRSSRFIRLSESVLCLACVFHFAEFRDDLFIRYWLTRAWAEHQRGRLLGYRFDVLAEEHGVLGMNRVYFIQNRCVVNGSFIFLSVEMSHE